MRKVKQLISFFLFTVILFSSQLMYAQTTTASINGSVVDQIGNALPGANVIAVHQPTGTQYGTTTRVDGKYNLVSLRVGGPYIVTVSFVGYTTQVESGFSLELSQNLKIDFKLPEQAVQLTGVTVTAEKGAIMSQARTGSSQSVTAKTIQEIPTITRSFQTFAKLSPMFEGTGYGAAGRSSKFNNIQIDGAQYNDLFGLGSSGLPGGQTSINPISLDAIEEFQVVVAPFDVRFGGFTGGGINAITRGGTNQLKGSAYFYGRNQSLVGQNWDETIVNDFKDYQYGFRVGGPIIKDKLFFSVSGEMTKYSFPISNAALIGGVANAAALADRFASIMKNKYGMDPGSYGEFQSERPSTKLFVRFDYNLSENHKLTLRHNYVDGYDDNMNGRGGNSALSFDSYNYRINNTTNSTVLQLNSAFSNKFSNELILGYTTIRDRRAGTSAATPEIQVGETGLQINAGPDRFSSANELDQDVFEVTDNFSYFVGNHTFTIGTHNEFFSFRNLFLRSFYGLYQFNNLNDLDAGKVSFYQRTLSRVAGDPSPAAKFSVAQLGFYIQDEWAVTPTFKLTAGLRVDMPMFPDTPAKNDSISKYFPGYATDVVPTGNLLWSPRIGFNYDMSGDRTTQLRGGVGIFTGRVPYVWMSNNFGNSGMLTAEVNNASGQSPAITMDINNLPGVGSPGTGAANYISEVDLAGKDVKLPQLLRYNLAIDHQLPLGFIGTVEFQYSKSINDMIYRKLNIKPIKGYVAALGSGNDGRPIYGGTDSKNNNFRDVLEIYNTSSGYQYNLVFQIQRNVARGLSVNAAYTYGQAKDRSSVSSSQAQSQMRYNPIDYDANSPDLTTSLWEVKDRIFASVSYVEEFFKNAPTTISIYYNGQSGAPYSFSYSGDLNGDGLDRNDLFYVPRNSSEILLGTISSGQYVPATSQNYNDLFNFINNNPYLSENKGKISERNAANSPFNHNIDLRIAQEIPDLWGMGKFTVSLDVLNFLNLLNNEWGWQQDVSWYYLIATYRGVVTYNGKPNTPVFSYAKPKSNTTWSPLFAQSRWAMQLGVRYTF